VTVERTVSTPLPKLAPVASILRRHRLHRHDALGPDHESLPVPVHGPEGLRIVRMLAPTRLDPETTKRFVKPPSYLVAARADSGTFAEARAVSSAAFELSDAPDLELGELVLVADLSDRVATLCTLLDAVLPSFAAGPAAPLVPVQRAAIEARDAFFALAETPLVPYYRALGKRFFAFLDRAATAK